MSILSSLLGLDASADAGKAQNQAKQNNAQSGALYGQLGNIGTSNAAAYGQVPGAINTFQQGVNSNPLLSLFQHGTTESPLAQAFAQAYGLNVGGANIPGHDGNRTAGVPGSQGSAPQSGGMNQNILPQDAYGLTQPQQIQLNTQLNNLDQAKQSAIAQYQSSFSQRGGDPSQMAAGIAAINEQFSALSEQTKGSFAQNALKDRQQGLGTLLSGGEAAQTQQNAGNLSVADLLMQLGGQGAGQIGQAAGGYGSLAGAAQQQSNVARQQSNADMGAVLSLIGTAATGGIPIGNPFGGGGGQSPIMQGVDLSQTGY